MSSILSTSPYVPSPDLLWALRFDQFTLVSQLCLTLCNPMNCNMPGFPVHHQLPEFTQTQLHWVSDAIQSSHPLSSPSPPTFNFSQNQGLFQWVISSHRVAKVMEFQLQHQSFSSRTSENRNLLFPFSQLAPVLLNWRMEWSSFWNSFRKCFQ